MKRRTMRRAASSLLGLVSALLLIGVVLTPVAQSQSTATAIENATIIPQPGQVIESGTIVIRDGLIVAVGTNVTIPYDAEVLDGKGLTVYAGFIEGSASFGLTEVKYAAGPAESDPVDFRTASLASTRPANRKDTQPDLAVANYFNPSEKDAAALRKLGFTSALLTPPSAILGGQSALIALAGQTRRSAVIASPIAMHASLRASRGSYPSTLMGTMAHLRQVLLDAQRHRRLLADRQRQGTGPRVPYDPALEALFPVLDGKLPLTFAVTSDVDIMRVVGLANEFGFTAAIDGADEAWRVAPTLANEDLHVVLHLDFPAEPKLPKAEKTAEKKAEKKAKPSEEEKDVETKKTDDPDPATDLVDGPPEEQPETQKKTDAKGDKKPSRFEDPLRWKQDEHRRWLERVQGAEQLAKAGVGFSLSSRGADAKFHEHLARAITEGLSAEHALAALTVEPARRYGVADRLGTIAVGKAAHLTLLNAPLGEEKNSVAYVFVDGEKLEVEGKKKPKGKKTGDRGPLAVLTGEWAVDISSDQGEQQVTWKLDLKEGQLTGTMESEMGSLELASSSLSGKDLQLEFVAEFGNESFELKFEGQIEGKSASGSLETPMGGATWTAIRTKTPEADESAEVEVDEEAEETTEGGGPAVSALVGSWDVAVSSDDGDQEVTWSIEMTEGKLTGTMGSEMGDIPLKSGSLSGQDLVLVFLIEFGSESFELKFTGQVDGDSASGSVDSPMGAATWSAQRDPKQGGVR